MAKKKVSHQPQDPKHQNPLPQTQTQTQTQTLNHHPPSSTEMEDSKEKLQNLKSLNAMLLKETLERRQQVESLGQAKEALEAELARSGAEKMGLEFELTRLGGEIVGLEIEKGLFCVFMKTQRGEMGGLVDGLVKEKMEKESEIGSLKSEVNGLILNVENERERLTHVCRERDLLKSDLDNWVKEADGFRVKVIEMQKKKREAEEEMAKLKMQYFVMIKQEREKEKAIEELKRLRDSTENNLEERVKEIENLKVIVEGIVSEKNKIEIEKGGQKVKISELEKEVWQLNEIVLSLKKDEGALCEKVMELEKSCSEALKKEKTMAMEIDALMEEKREKEKTIEKLVEERNSSQKIIDMANIERKDKDRLIEKLLREKKEIEEVKIVKEGEILELQNEVGKLREHVFAMQRSIKDREDKNKQLASEVSHNKDASEKLRLERDSAQKYLDEEKKDGMSLRSKVVEMEKKVEEITEQLVKVENEYESLIKEKKEADSQIDLVAKEKDLVQKNLLEAQREIDELISKMDSAGVNSERALTLLKNTAALLSQSNDGKEEAIVTEKKLDGGIEPYAIELEVIKTAFRKKETAVEEMKQQVVLLQNSVTKAHKRNSFWAMVSSATTVVAAASIAYAAKLR